jgi:small-conductance mechanosensitive channel
MQEFLYYQIYGNSGQDYLIALTVVIGSLIILKIAQKIIIARLRKLSKVTATKVDDILIEVIGDIKPFFYFVVAIYLGLRMIELPQLIWNFIQLAFLSVIVYESIQAGQKIVQFITYQALKKNDDDKQAKMTSKTLNIFVQIALWSFGLILILSNMGVNVSSLLAGLGIGGIAVALALQNILGDIFSSFSILIDKPFQVGDFIKIGTDLGTVEKIGIKTTRLRTLDGQILVVSNRELTTTRVENFQQIQKRRSLFSLGLVYETSREDLEKAKTLIKEIIDQQERAEFDRCHFKSYGDFSLNFEVSFFVSVDSYAEFLDVVEQVNLEIFSAFKENNLNFAYPTHLQYQKRI